MAFRKSASKKIYTENTLYDYAVATLGRRMRTVAEIKRLMRTRVAEQPEGEQLVEAVTARLKAQRYLSDSSFAASYSSNRRDNEKFGARRVEQDLRAKGVHPEVIGRALGEAYEGVDEEKLARQFIERKRIKQPQQQKDAARVFRMMVRAGFSSRVIFRILREWKIEDETLSALEQEREMAESGPQEQEDES
jgi:regulatory protein